LAQEERGEERSEAGCIFTNRARLQQSNIKSKMDPKVFSILDASASFTIRRTLRRSHVPRWLPPAETPKLEPVKVDYASCWSVSKAKRLLDVVVSLNALIFLSPLMFLLALMVAATSKGPVLFAQRRIGRGGKLFTIFKFRTMEITAGKQVPTAITVRGDRRITPVGALLRRYKLDELPQFLNVLNGDMSLVGPRPKLPHHEGMTMPFRPGLTGAATLAFRHEEDLLRAVPVHDLERFYEDRIKPIKAKLDMEYMQRSTPATDLVLILRTATSCIASKPKQPYLDLLSSE
jgi:lipopolysaccharide/colanic/teichoic acid biosynthesis glycosyltransferase